MSVSAEWLRLRAVAMEAARAGGRAALPYFRRPELAVEWKADDSPVTHADRSAEAAIKAVIAAACPDDAWLGEESGASERLGTGNGPTSGRRWIIDPIDGTRNFVRGVPLWAVLVACEAELPGGPQVVAAAVGIPALDEWYDAVLGGGARANGSAIAVSSITRLDQALWCFETPASFAQHGLGAVFQQLVAQAGLCRGLGDAYSHMLVASGRAELVIEPQLSVWDVAATSLVVSEAGGRFSDLAGTASLRSNNAIVTNGRLHTEVVALVHRLKEGR